MDTSVVINQEPQEYPIVQPKKTRLWKIMLMYLGYKNERVWNLNPPTEYDSTSKDSSHSIDNEDFKDSDHDQFVNEGLPRNVIEVLNKILSSPQGRNLLIEKECIPLLVQIL